MKGLLALALVIAPSVAAQSPAQRVTVDSLVRVVEQRRSTDGEVDVDLMRKVETVFAESVDKYGKWAQAWYGLGIARLELARADVLAREGPELPLGMNNAYGGERALMRAIEIDHGFAAAANALAMTPTIREPDNRLRERMTAGRLAYSVMSGPALAAAAYPEREVGSIDSAAALEERALVKGDVDSALVMLPLARDLFRLGANREGRQALVRAAATTTLAGQRAYRAELQWVASPVELVQWDSLPATERPDWVASFWSKRDVAEGRRDGARLEEHYRRIEYAMKTFRISLPKTGRPIFPTLAMPSTAEPYDTERRARLAILRNPNMYPDAAALFSMGKSIGSESSSRYYHPIQDLVNDKGIIWIRHGKPTRIATNPSGPSFEIWRYERPEGALILNFRQVDFEGSNMPNELVPTLLDASAVIKDQLCGLDQTLCPTTILQGNDFLPFGSRVNGEGLAVVIQRTVSMAGGKLGPEAVVRSANRGKEFIDLAITTDTYHRDFTHAIHPSLQVLGLDRASGGAPRMVIAFAIPAQDLSHSTMGGRTVYPVQFQVMASATRDGRRIDADTLRQFATAAPLGDGEFLTGMMEVPIAAGGYSVSVMLTQADGHGAIAHLGGIDVPVNRDLLAVSDLVLGSEKSGVRWNSGATSVPLNPLNAYPRGGSAEAYFQLSGLTVGATYAVQLDISRADDAPDAPARVSVTSPISATASRMEVSRSLVLANLDPARYRVRLKVTGGGRAVTASAWLTVVK